jgi:hypothetical protein
MHVPESLISSEGSHVVKGSRRMRLTIFKILTKEIINTWNHRVSDLDILSRDIYLGTVRRNSRKGLSIIVLSYVYKADACAFR